MPSETNYDVLPDGPRLQSRPHPPEAGCRLCGTRLHSDLINFGHLPLTCGTISAAQPGPEALFPLHIRVCDSCTLVQLADVPPPLTLGLSGPPTAPVLHQRLAATLIQKWRLGADSHVVQIGSGDGTLLRHFHDAGVSVFGVEAVPEIAQAATAAGISTETANFTSDAAMQIAVGCGRADLLVVDGVLPKAADMFDFAAGLASMIRPNGVIAISVPHVLPLLQNLQFDAFRHDVPAYLSLRVLERLLCSVGLRVFDAERVTEYGGRLRVFACAASSRFTARPGLKTIRAAEAAAETECQDLYSGFSARAAASRNLIRDFIATRQAAGRHMMAYGATPRAGMLLNLCEFDAQTIRCVADPDCGEAGQCLPGSRVPIAPETIIRDDPPDDLLVLSWSYGHDVPAKLHNLRQKGMQCWTLMPRIARV